MTILLTPAWAIAQSADEKAVRSTIDHYFRGHSTGNGNEMRKAFLQTAHIEGNREGKFA